MTCSQPALPTLALLLLPLPAAADVLVVDDDPGPGVDHATIGAAVAAAQDGDVVLVRAGYYPPFQIDGKSLTVVADGGFAAVNYTSVVTGLGPTQRALLAGLQLGPTALPLQIEGNAGAVWVHDCRAEGDTVATPGPEDAVHATASAAVVVTASTFAGAPENGGSGLVASGGDVHAWDSAFRGGTPNLVVADGADGLRIGDGFLYTSGCDFEGGDGTDGFDTGLECVDPGDGGHGLALQAGTDAVLVDLHGAGGAAGDAAPGCPSAGADGQALAVDPGATQEAPALAAARSFLVEPYLLRDGEPGTLILEAAPGDLAFVAVTGPAAPSYAPPFTGSTIAPDLIALLDLGTVPATGTLAVPFTAATPDGHEARVLTLQGVFLSAADGVVVSSPSPLVLLDPAF